MTLDKQSRPLCVSCFICLHLQKPPRVQNVPPYNPLDKANKDQSLTDVVATKKFPYSKPDTITTIGKECWLDFILEFDLLMHFEFS